MQVKLPLTHLDLGGLSDLSASVDLSGLDSLLAVGLPCLLALIALPVCLARAAMLGLDCVAVRIQVEQILWLGPVSLARAAILNLGKIMNTNVINCP